MSGHSTKKDVNYCQLMSIITMRSIGYFPQTLRPIVYVFLNFERNFANLVAPSTDGSAKRLVRYKVHLVP